MIHKTSCKGRAQTVSISTYSLLFSKLIIASPSSGKHINCLTLQVNSHQFLLIIAKIIYQCMHAKGGPISIKFIRQQGITAG
jgi:hypothetical protein